ncbi:MAG: hypothetical protein QOJ51_5560, partial [Acidobacteriaceae bacterium]|nr:hypothetical protein [Acidobacteriaceae bacterium]
MVGHFNQPPNARAGVGDQASPLPSLTCVSGGLCGGAGCASRLKAALIHGFPLQHLSDARGGLDAGRLARGCDIGRAGPTKKVLG